MTEARRPVPPRNIFVASDAFWDGAQNGKLMLQYCPTSGRFQHIPRPISIHTGHRDLEWREASGRGTIYACTILRVPNPGVTHRLPLVVATVELEEGVRIIANIVESKAEDVKIGQNVELVFDKLEDDVAYPAFRIAAG